MQCGFFWHRQNSLILWYSIETLENFVAYNPQVSFLCCNCKNCGKDCGSNSRVFLYNKMCLAPNKINPADLRYRLDIPSCHYDCLRQQAITILSIRLWSVPASEVDFLVWSATMLDGVWVEHTLAVNWHKIGNVYGDDMGNEKSYTGTILK